MPSLDRSKQPASQREYGDRQDLGVLDSDVLKLHNYVAYHAVKEFLKLCGAH
jgi:hypothetical protein